MPSTTPTTARPTRPLAVLFDLDGTLIDSIELILGSMRHAFATCRSSAPSDAEWLTGVGTPLRTMFQRFSSDEEEIERLIEAYRAHQLLNHDRLVRCYDEITDMLTAVAQGGHPMGVVTSKSESLARRGLEHAGILEFFQTIVGLDSCTRHKPDPEPVLTALNRLGYQPGEAVFVGDSVHDVEAGNAAGVLSVAALWGPFSRDQLAKANPGRFLERPSALSQLLAEL